MIASRTVSQDVVKPVFFSLRESHLSLLVAKSRARTYINTEAFSVYCNTYKRCVYQFHHLAFLQIYKYYFIFASFFVASKGLEPLRLSTRRFELRMSTNSITRPFNQSEFRPHTLFIVRPQTRAPQVIEACLHSTIWLVGLVGVEPTRDFRPDRF